MSARTRQDGSPAVVWNEQQRMLVAREVHRRMCEGERLTGSMIESSAASVLPANQQRRYLTPRDKWLVNLLATFQPPGLRVAAPPAPAKITQQEETLHLEDTLNRPVATLKFPATARGEIRANNITTLRQLTQIDPHKFSTRGFNQIVQALEASGTGLTVGMEITSITAPEVIEPVVLFTEEKKVSLPTEHSTTRPGYIDSKQLTKVMLDALTPMLNNIADHIVDIIGGVAVGSTTIISERVQQTLQTRAEEGRSYIMDPAKAHKKKVVVIGPLNPEASMLQNLFHDRIYLCTYNKDQSLDTLNGYLNGADHVIVMTGNCEHAATSKIKSKFAGKPIYVNGGYTRVKETIQQLLQ